MNTILLGLTKFSIWSQNGKFIRTQIIRIPNYIEQEVAIFSGDTWFIGQCTLFRTIIINESVLENKRLLDYVLIHEFAHTKQWWSLFSIPLGFVLIFSFYTIFVSLIFLIQAITSINATYLFGFIVWLIISIFTFVIPCLFSWILEFDAEFAAIKYMGLDTFIEIRGDLQKTRTLSLSGRIIRRLTHPTDGITVRVWHWFHKTR